MAQVPGDRHTTGFDLGSDNGDMWITMTVTPVTPPKKVLDGTAVDGRNPAPVDR